MECIKGDLEFKEGYRFKSFSPNENGGYVQFKQSCGRVEYVPFWKIQEEIPGKFNVLSSKSINSFYNLSSKKINDILNSEVEERDKLYSLKKLLDNKDISLNQFIVNVSNIK